MKLNSWIAIACLAVLLLGAGCASRQPLKGTEVSGFDKKLSTFIYMESGDLMTLIVGTRPARDKDGSEYFPLEFAVANRGLRSLGLTLESFTLIDGEGNRYPAATPSELLRNYDMLDFDRNLAEIDSVTFNRFGAMARYPSNFTPTRTVQVNGTNLTRDRLGLAKHGYIIDFLYFPTPPGGILGQPFELFVDSPDLPDPVFVKFEVR
jgi:hypothetical protein